MKKTLFAIAMLLLQTTLAHATPYIPQNSYPETFSVNGQWLYFSPNSESSYYYAQSDAAGNVDGQRHANKLDNYHSGYRVGIGYTPCECGPYFTTTWSELRANHSDSITSPIGVFPTVGPADLIFAGPAATASASHHFHYFALDSAIGQTFIRQPSFNLSLFGGLHYARLISNDNYAFVGFTDDDGGTAAFAGTEANNFWGIGPQIGFQAQFPIWCGLSFFGNTSGALLAGKPDTTLSYLSTVTSGAGTTVTPFVANNDRVWRCVPQVDFELGFCYDFSFSGFGWSQCCNGFSGSFEIGYEMLTYFDGLSNTIFPASAASASFDNYRNVTMHGLTLGLSLGF